MTTNYKLFTHNLYGSSIYHNPSDLNYSSTVHPYIIKIFIVIVHTPSLISHQLFIHTVHPFTYHEKFITIQD